MAKFIITMEIEFDPCITEGSRTLGPNKWAWEDVIREEIRLKLVTGVKVLNISPVSGMTDEQMSRMDAAYRILHE